MSVEYTYAAAYVKSLENNMLKKEDYTAILNADGAEEIMRILRSKGYEGGTISDMTENERRKVWDLCFELCGNIPQMKTLMLADDFHNIKAVLKATMSDREWESLIYEPTDIDCGQLADAFKKDDFSEIDDRFSQICENAYKIYVKSGDGQSVEIYLDRAELEKMAEESEDEFVRGYREILALCANLRIYLRSDGKDSDFLENALVRCSLISKQSLVKSRKSKEETLRDEGFKEAYDLYSRSPAEFEKYCDNMVIEYAKKAEMSFFDFDAVLGYLVGKMTEIKNIRLAAAGNLGREPQEEIKERLRDSYV